MILRKFDTIYVNGCSHTAGGGLYENSVKEYYFKEYGIKWGTEREVNFPKYLGDHFECNLVDESMCGSGAPRLVRATYDYIFKVGIEKAKKTLFIFQINTPVHRLEYYCNEINDYLIVNVQYKEDGSFDYVRAVDSHSPNETKYGYKFFEETINKDIEFMLSNYHEPFLYLQKIHNEIVGLFSFLERNNIEFFYGFDTGDCIRRINQDRKIDIDGDQTIHEFSVTNNMRLCDETNNHTIDTHPGYFAHKRFSEKLISFIEKKLKPTLWVFGDSYSSMSTPEYGPNHKLYNNDFRVKYSKFKGYFPKHFPEIIAEKLEINLKNFAIPSTSNEQIFQSFIENIENIKPNDILFFGWTYVSRYNLSNRDNELENINIPREGEITFEDNLSSNSLNEILYNRGSHTIFYKLLSNNIKLINKLFNNNIILHSDFFPHGNIDDYVKEYLNFLIPRKEKYQTIFDDAGGEYDIHYSENGHLDFAKDVMEQIQKRYSTVVLNKKVNNLI
jgi:hypothetical protein